MTSTEKLSQNQDDGSSHEHVVTSELEELNNDVDQLKPDDLNKSRNTITTDIQNDINDLLDNVPELNSVFIIADKIGSGTFSSVYLAKLKNYPVEQTFALKHIIPTSHPTRIENELKCLIDIGGCDNIIEVKACFRQRDHVVIIMPYFEHNKFQDYVDLLSIDEIRSYMRSLLTALRRVHSIDLIHRDVKPSNFLFNRTLQKFALVDFGLAQKAPVPLKTAKDCSKSKINAVSKPSSNLSTVGCKSGDSALTTAARKRKLEVPENDDNPKKKIHCQLDVAKNERDVDSKVEPENRKLQLLDQNRLAFKSTAIFKSTYSKSAKLTSLNLVKPQDETDDAFKKKKSISPGCRQELMLPKKGSGSAFMRRPSVMGICGCFGQPTVCNICLCRASQHAPRAGTPGFRAPEVLMKHPGQTTAVDIWSAGVIMLSLLSGRYPFFKAADDMTSLAQIISVFGYLEVKSAASAYGKKLLVGPEIPAHDLKQLCEKLRVPRSSPNITENSREKAARSFCKSVPDSAYDLLRKLLDLNPFTRITAEDALKHEFFEEESST